MWHGWSWCHFRNLMWLQLSHLQCLTVTVQADPLPVIPCWTVAAIKPSPLIWGIKTPFSTQTAAGLTLSSWSLAVGNAAGALLPQDSCPCSWGCFELCLISGVSESCQNIPDFTGNLSKPWCGGTDILMQICRFETPRSCWASPTGREGRVSLALSLTWAELWPKDSSLELQWSISWFIILTVGNSVLLWSWIS